MATRSETRRGSAFARNLRLNPISVVAVPLDSEERRLLGALVDEDIRKAVRGRLSQADFAMWQAGQAEKWSSADKKRILGTVDYVIVERSQTLTWRIFASPVALYRIQRWCDRGAAHLKKLFRAVELGSSVARGKAKLPIAGRERQEWRDTKKRAVSELRVLFRRHKTEFNQKRQIPSHKTIRDWFQNATEHEPFRLLQANQTSFLRYLDYTQKHDSALHTRILLSEAAPATFFDSWAAWSRNLSPESLRQAIAKV